MRIEEKIDQVFLAEMAMSGSFKKILDKLLHRKSNDAKKKMKNSWDELSKALRANALERDAIDIINKYLHTNYHNLDQINRMDIKNIPTKGVYEELMVEDFAHFWEKIRSEAFMPLAFYPLLQVFMEVDKLLKGLEANYTMMVVYGLFWLFLVSGKFVGEYSKWKRENQEEWKREGSRRNPFALKNKEDRG